MIDQAEKADEYWAPRLGYKETDTPFADTYEVIFRHCSSRTHALIQGLNDVIEPTPSHDIIVLDRISDHMPSILRSTLMIFGLGLCVSAAVLAIPRREDIESLMQEYLQRRARLDDT